MERSVNEKEPLVSIIIPVYNVKPYLRDALDSVINQTYKNIEIIIVDDGSNDGSEEICDEYTQNDTRIKLIHRENGGLSAARNTGLDNMSGEYVAFLDSDDVFVPDTIEKSLNAMVSNGVDCVNFRYVMSKNPKNIKFENLPEDKIRPVITHGIYSREEAMKALTEQKLDVSAWTKLSKREIWNNLRFPEGHVYEDIYIIFQMIEKIEKIYIMDEVLIIYRDRAGSITNTNSIKNFHDLLDFWYILKKYVEQHTPELFQHEKTQEFYKTIFYIYVTYYARILSGHMLINKESLNAHKKEVENLEKTVNIKNCRFVTRLTYNMIIHHPILLSIFFLPCYYMYKTVKKIIWIVKK